MEKLISFRNLRRITAGVFSIFLTLKQYSSPTKRLLSPLFSLERHIFSYLHVAVVLTEKKNRIALAFSL